MELPFWKSETELIWNSWKPYFEGWLKWAMTNNPGGILDQKWWRSRFYDDTVGHGPGQHQKKIDIPDVWYGNYDEKFNLIESRITVYLNRSQYGNKSNAPVFGKPGNIPETGV